MVPKNLLMEMETGTNRTSTSQTLLFLSQCNEFRGSLKGGLCSLAVDYQHFKEVLPSYKELISN
jgi:hypothetical protein